MERARNWVNESAAMLLLHGKSRLFTKPPHSYLEHREGKTPIILIPGLTEKWGVLGNIAKIVSNEGFDVYTVPKLGFNLYDIYTTTKIVEDAIRLNGLQDPYILAHSKGGLPGKWVLIHGLASKMITYATPHSGSDIAEYIPFFSAQELTSQSMVIQELNKYKDVNKNIVSIFNKTDNLIPNGCRLEGARNVEISGYGHHKILIDRRVFKITKEILNFWEEERLKK